MSAIDNRIIQMQFENSQFEKGVKQSMQSVEKLEDSLQFKKAEKSLNALQKAGDSFTLAGMARGIDAIEDKFSVMGIVGKRILEDLTDSAVRMGTSFIKSVSIDQVASGWNKYAEKTSAVQTIVAATGKDIGYVDEQLSKLAWFTDETSYNFVDMTSNIGKFTSMGIDLGTSVTAMQGIATWAAVSGQNATAASRAMYNLSQAIGVGSVKLMDWKSIENANMATKEFKQTAIATAQAMGKITKQGKTAKGTLVSYENFSQTLSEGWFTKDVLLKTLEKYGEYADAVYKVATEKGITAAEAMKYVSAESMALGEKAFKAAQEAKTFGEAIDSVKDAVSTGWMNIFENLFGNYEEAKVLWTDLANFLWDVFAAPLSGANELLAKWKEMGGREKALKGIYDIFHAIGDILATIGDAFEAVFPPVTVDRLLEISEGIERFGASFRSSFGRYVTEFDVPVQKEDELGRLLKENNFTLESRGEEVKKLQDKLVELGLLSEDTFVSGVFGPSTQNALEKFQSGVDDTSTKIENMFNLGDEGEEVKKLQKQLEELGFSVGSAGIDGIYGPQTKKAYEEYEKSLESVDKKRKELKRGARGDDVKEMQQMLINAGYLDKGQADGIFGPKTEAALKEYQKAKGITETGLFDKETIKNMFPEHVAPNDGDIETEIHEMVDYSDKMNNLLKITRGFASALHIVGSFFKFVGKVAGHIWKLLGPLRDAFVVIGAAIGDCFTTLDKSLTEAGTFDEWFKNAQTFLEPFGEWVKKASDALLRFFGLIDENGNLYKGPMSFTTLFENVKKSIMGLLGINIDAKEAGSGIDTKGIIEQIKSKITEIYTGVRDWIVGLFSKKGASPEDGKEAALDFNGYNLAIAAITGIIAIISGRLLQAVGTIIKLGKNVNGILKGIKSTISNLRQKVAFEKVDNIAGALLKFAGAIALIAGALWLISQLKWEQLAVGLVGLAAIFGVLIGAMFLMKKAAAGFKNIDDVMKALLVLAVAIDAMAIGVLMLGQLSWEQLARGLVGIIALLGLCLGAIWVLNKNKVDTKAVGGTIGLIGSLAFGLGQLANVIKMLGSLSTETLIKGFIALAAIMIAIGLFMKAAGKIKIEWTTVAGLVAAGLAIGLVVGSFLALAFAMKFLKLADLLKAFVGMIAVVATIALLLKLINKINPNPRAILALIPAALAIDLVIAGFVALALTMKHVSFTDILKAVHGVAVVVLSIITLIGLTSLFKPRLTGLLALIPAAIAIDLVIAGFVGLMLAMKHVSFTDMMKAIYGMEVVVLAIVAMTIGISAAKPSIRGVLALIPIAVALDLAIGGFILLAIAMKNVGWGQLAKAILSFVVIVGAMVIMSKALSKASGGIKGSIGILISSLAMIGAMVAFAIALNYIKDIKTGKILAFAAGLSMVMLALGGMALMAKAAGVGGVLTAALAIVAITAAIGLVIAAFAALNKIPGFQEFMNSGAASIGQIIGAFVEEIEAAKFRGMAKGLSELNSAECTVDQTQLDNMMNTVNAFTAFTNGLPDYPLVEKLVPWAKTNVDLVMSDMQSFATGINNFTKGMKLVETDDFDQDKMNTAMDIVKGFAKFNNDLPQKSEETKIVDWLTGYSNLGSTLKDMTDFASGLNIFAAGMKLVKTNEIDEAQISAAESIVKNFAEFSNNLPKKTVEERAIDWITKHTDLENQLKDMNGFAEGMSTFAENMPLVASGLENYDDAKMQQAMTIVKGFAEFNNNLPKKSTDERLVDWITKHTDLENQLKDMNGFAEGMATFATQMPLITAGLDNYDDAKMQQAMSIFKGFAEFNNTLPKKPTDERLVDWITKNTNLGTNLKDMDRFAEGMATFATQMPLITAGLDNYDDSKMQQAMGIVQGFANFSKGLPAATVGERLLKWIHVGSKIDGIMDDMDSFVSGFNGFSLAMNDITWSEDLETNTGNAIKIATDVANFLVELNKLDIEKDKGAIKKWFTDETSQETVFNALGDFATAISQSKEAFADLGGGTFESDVTAATNALRAVASFLNYAGQESVRSNISNNSWYVYEWIRGFFFDEDGVLDTIKDFAAETEGIDLNSIANAISAVSEFSNLLTHPLTTENPDKNPLKGIDISDVVAQVNAFVLEVSPTFDQAGIDLATAMSTGMTEAEFTGPDTVATNAITALNDYQDDFKTVGGNFAVGLGNGINDWSWWPVLAAATVANKMVTTIQTIFDSRSPSRVTTQFGKYFTEGLAIGTKERIGDAESSAEQVANSMLDTASGTLSTLSSLLAEDIDDTPVIAPVVDLTNARATAAQIGSLFGSQDIGVTSQYMAKEAQLSTNNGRPVTIQNGSINTSEAVDGVNERLTALTNAISTQGAGTTDDPRSLADRFSDLAEAVTNLKIVLDSGVLVGEIMPAIDSGLGTYAMRRDRGN